MMADMTEKNIGSTATYQGRLVPRTPKTQALESPKQASGKNMGMPETLINTGFQLGNTWQHPKSPQKEVSNIVEAPKNAASALLGASLGEDKYFLIF